MNGFNEIKERIKSGNTQGIRVGTNLFDGQVFKTPSIEDKSLWRNDKSINGWDLYFITVIPEDEDGKALSSREVSFTEDAFEDIEADTQYTANVALIKKVKRLQSVTEVTE